MKFTIKLIIKYTDLWCGEQNIRKMNRKRKCYFTLYTSGVKPGFRIKKKKKIKITYISKIEAAGMMCSRNVKGHTNGLN
jgi:hypothetical protein